MTDLRSVCVRFLHRTLAPSLIPSRMLGFLQWINKLLQSSNPFYPASCHRMTLVSILHHDSFRSITVLMSHRIVSLKLHSYLKTLRVDNLQSKSCWVFPKIAMTNMLTPASPIPSSSCLLLSAFYYLITATRFLSYTSMRNLEHCLKL